jgi:small subunit ribosomal protein S6
MIYELVVALKQETTEEKTKLVTEMVDENLAAVEGESLAKDDWGVYRFAAPMDNKFTHGRYLYFMFKSNGSTNLEIMRKLRLNEDVIRFLVVVVGQDKHQEELLKTYKNPANFQENLSDDDLEKDRKMLSKKRSCWFSANKTSPDWKNPMSYHWLVNEFGKITPARVSGLRPRFQRKANDAIKRGRVMGFISFTSNRIAIK